MNIDADERERREASRHALRELVERIQSIEPAMIEAAERAAAQAIHQNYPVVAGYAIQSGSMRGKLTLEIIFDLTPKEEAVEVRATVEPPPVTSVFRESVPGLR